MSSANISSDFAAARQVMIDSQLRPQGVTNPAVIAAMASVAREDYVPAAMRDVAYADRSIPLGDGQSLSAPAALAQLLNGLAPGAGERALVVGGNGYSSALLKAMGCDVCSGDGSSSGRGTVDCILIDGAVETIPETLTAQLADGGRLAGGLVQDGVTRLILGVKAGESFGYRIIGDAGLPRLAGFERPQAFTF